MKINVDYHIRRESNGMSLFILNGYYYPFCQTPTINEINIIHEMEKVSREEAQEQTEVYTL